MDISKISGKAAEWLKKYRYPVLILLIGLVLLTLPGKKQTETVQTPLAQNQPAATYDLAKELEQILSQIQGVGKVQVLLTQAAGEHYQYHTDEDIQTSEGSSTIRKETVIVTDSDRNQSPLIVQVVPPKYRGAIIVCQGGLDAAVKLAVVEAVSKITGLGANSISVLKMK